MPEESKNIYVFKDERYCCPFCSHGDTIFYRERYNSASKEIIYYLQCDESCFSYVVGTMDRNTLKVKDCFEKRESELFKIAEDYFNKFIEYCEGKEDFIVAR